MRIAGVEFPESLLTALRNGQLVVFAGAGVSMGSPANLPSFHGLADRIAQGTGLSITETETEDQFLDRIKAAGPDIHQRASQILQQSNPQPTDLHRNILRLYRGSDNATIVTTNFDTLFEQAATKIYDQNPKVFHGPALPLGQRFKGIVHIHGAVNDPQEMILTSEDFGRAYLTEAEGWARRFLVDLFANNTVLFVGYSHNDTIMTYLSRSLNRHESNRRYALIGSETDKPARWKTLGIQPIAFPQEAKDDYSQLDRAIADLANHVHRGILNWQSEITAIAAGMPPIDEEAIGIIEHTLSDPILTRFFTDTAELPEWINWLDRHNHLSELFADGELNEQQRSLAYWLANQFTANHPDTLFSVIQRHGAKLNPHLWATITNKLTQIADNTPGTKKLARWILFLVNHIPAQASILALQKLAETCTNTKMLDCLLQVYDVMTARINRLLTLGPQNTPSTTLREISQIWDKCLAPNLPTIAEPLLVRTSIRLMERQSIMKAWNNSDNYWFIDVLWHPAIEPHEQNRYSHESSRLIDIARDSLEWLIVNQPNVAKQWSELHIKSPVISLRRLAIHTLTARTDLSASDKIAMLLEHCDIHDVATRHEIFRAAKDAYPRCAPEQREKFIKAILSFQWSQEDDPDKEVHSTHQKFNWLDWLQKAEPNDKMIAEAIDSIKAKFPSLQPQPHPDFVSYIKITSVPFFDKPSPWTVSEMLSFNTPQWLPLALAHQSQNETAFWSDELYSNIVEATKQQPSWGIDLATEMARTSQWNNNLWKGIIDGFGTAQMNEQTLEQVLNVISDANIHKIQGNTLATVLRDIIKTNHAVIPQTILTISDEIAKNLWQHIQTDERAEPDNWMLRAINHPAGILAEYWVQSIAIWYELQTNRPNELSRNYHDALSMIMMNSQLSGILARVIFTGNLPFLSLVDENWVKNNLIPLLSPNSNEFESAWDGTSWCGRISPQTAELLRLPALNAIKSISNTENCGLRQRFTRLYITLLTWFANDPEDQWIRQILTEGSTAVKQQFANEIHHILRSSDQYKQEELWNTWLKGYWEKRLLGYPVPLDEDEITEMMDWPIALEAVYPEAVDLAVQMKPVHLEHRAGLYRLTDSNLPTKHPESVAKFLIHIDKIEQYPQIWCETDQLIDLLIQSGLETGIEYALKELKAKIGI